MQHEAMDLCSEAKLAALRPQLVSRAMWLTRNRADAEDLAQTAILRALERCGAIEQREVNIHAWALVVVRRLAIDQFRSRRRWRTCDDVDPAVLQAPADPAAPRWIAITMEQLLAAVSRCPAHYRRVYELHDLEGRSYAEIAEALQLPIGTVGTRLRRARLRIRACIELDLANAEAERSPRARSNLGAPPKLAGWP